MLTTWSRVALARYGGSFVTLFVVFSLQVNTTWCFMDLNSLWSGMLRINACHQLSVKISCTMVEKPCSHAVDFICCRVVNYELHWQGLGNTRVRHTNAAKRAPNMWMHHCHVNIRAFARSPSCGNFKPTRTSPVEQQVETTGDGGETSRTKIRAGQHARPSHKHCKACTKNARAPRPRARTRLYDFHWVRFSNQPLPVQLNNKLKQQVWKMEDGSCVCSHVNKTISTT